MKKTKNLMLLCASLLATIATLGLVFLFSNNTIGTLVLLVGLTALFLMFLLSVSGLLKGKIKLLKIDNRFNVVLLLAYTLLSSLVLLVFWSVNFVVQDEYGHMSPKDKIDLILGETTIIEEEIHAFVQDYPVLEYNHITFKYHPDTEENVQKILLKLNDISELENEIYGREVSKNEKLEVLVLRNETDYLQLNPFNIENEAGTYYPDLKRLMIFKDSEQTEEDDSFIIGTFVHEYSHYLFDLFITEEGLNVEEIPIWYNEGISEYMKKQLVRTDHYYQDEEQAINITDLHSNGNWRTAYEKTDVYFLALTGIEFIVGYQGDPGVLSQILLQQKEGNSFEEAYKNRMGLELDDLNNRMFTDKEDLEKAWITWDDEGDFERAEKLYEKITEKHPHDSLAWHHYAMMLEEEGSWGKALDARRKGIEIDPKDSVSFLSTSYLLTVIDTEESEEMAEKALELTKENPYENVDFVQKWVDEISEFNKLLAEENYVEAYEVLLKSEQLAYNTSLFEEVKRHASDYF